MNTFQFRFTGGVTIKKGESPGREVTSFALCPVLDTIERMDDYVLTPTNSIRKLFLDMIESAAEIHTHDLRPDLNQIQQAAVQSATSGVVFGAMTMLADTLLNTDKAWYERDQDRRDAFVRLGVRAFWLHIAPAVAQSM